MTLFLHLLSSLLLSTLSIWQLLGAVDMANVLHKIIQKTCLNCCRLSKNHWRRVLRHKPHFNVKFTFSIETRTLHPIVNADLSQTRVSVQTWIAVSPASHLKRESQPDSRFISNADPCQTRVSVQTQITARPAFHLKRGSQPDLCLNLNASLRAPYFNNRIKPVRVAFLL